MPPTACRAPCSPSAAIGRRYVRHVNTAYRWTGTLWEGRYRAAPTDGEAYFLACCRTIELNPLRARMVRHPRDYCWSSYRAHAVGTTDPLLTGHELYDRLGRTPAERQKEYRALFRAALDDDFVDGLRSAAGSRLCQGGALPSKAEQRPKSTLTPILTDPNSQ